MGRVRPTYIKRLAREIVEKDTEDEFGEDFEQNKDALREHAEFSSKKLRNRVAGYIVRVKQKKEEL